MDPIAESGEYFGNFIWNHFVNKYGSSHEAGIHTGDFVTSLRKHRDTSHRVRIFSEFAGVDVRRPQKALSLHIVVIHQILKVLRPDEDNGVVWCPLQEAEHAAHILINTKGKHCKLSAVTTFFSETLLEVATVDPISPKGKEKHVIDCDLFAEGLVHLIMADDHEDLEHLVDVMCERAEQESLISLPRFLSLMGVLNATLSDEMLVAEFEKMVATSDYPALTYDEFLLFVRQHPLDGSPGENEMLEKKRAPNIKLLQAAIDRFWYTQARRMRRTLEDLKTKEKRMSQIFHKFDHSLRYLERELSHGRIEILPELWVYARIMMGEALAIRTEEARERVSKPRPSFFRAKTRKLHIMKALLPRSAKY